MCRKKVHIGFKLPNMLRGKQSQIVTNRDRRQKTILKSWALSENAVTDRDKP